MRYLRRAFVGGSVAWAAALPIATFAASQPQPAASAYLFALATYLVGGAVCHQLDARSFHLWGHQMPVCARCTGIYGGAAIAGIIASWVFVPRSPSRRGPVRFSAAAVLSAAALPIGLSLAFEWTTGITPSNLTRAATGVVLGAAVAAVVVSGLSGAEAVPERTTL
jgi:uncharacterized membrane protein